MSLKEEEVAMENLTRKQRDILEYLKTQIVERRVPSFREIMRKFKFRGIKAVQDHLAALERKGYIRRDPGKARAIEVLGLRLLETVELPLIGRIAAGTPVLAEENIEGTIALDRSWVRGENSFVLKVQGDSMIEAGIHDGDYAILRQEYTAENNDIVAILIDNEATLKRFFRQNGSIVLKPENSAMEPIVIESGNSHVSIIGKLTGVYRNVE